MKELEFELISSVSGKMPSNKVTITLTPVRCCLKIVVRSS